MSTPTERSRVLSQKGAEAKRRRRESRCDGDDGSEYSESADSAARGSPGASSPSLRDSAEKAKRTKKRRAAGAEPESLKVAARKAAISGTEIRADCRGCGESCGIFAFTPTISPHEETLFREAATRAALPSTGKRRRELCLSKVAALRLRNCRKCLEEAAEATKSRAGKKGTAEFCSIKGKKIYLHTDSHWYLDTLDGPTWDFANDNRYTIYELAARDSSGEPFGDLMALKEEEAHARELQCTVRREDGRCPFVVGRPFKTASGGTVKYDLSCIELNGLTLKHVANKAGGGACQRTGRQEIVDGDAEFVCMFCHRDYHYGVDATHD